jgi:hypothetical protein
MKISNSEEMISAIKKRRRFRRREEGGVIPEGWSRTRALRDHYYLRNRDVIFHIAHKFPGSKWTGVLIWSGFEISARQDSDINLELVKNAR